MQWEQGVLVVRFVPIHVYLFKVPTAGFLPCGFVRFPLH